MNTQAVPTRPWEKEKSVRRRSTATLLLGALIAYVVVLFTGFAGPDGWAVVLFSAGLALEMLRRRRLN
mgnify:CR=1 FL=1